MVAPAGTALDRLLASFLDSLTTESAEQLLRFQLAPDLRRRIDELASKATEGTLSESERAEYSDFVEGIDLIGILQGKAQQIVRSRGGS